MLSKVETHVRTGADKEQGPSTLVLTDGESHTWWVLDLDEE